MARRYCDNVPPENFRSDASTRMCCEASRACASLLPATQDLSIKTHSAVHLSFSVACSWAVEEGSAGRVGPYGLGIVGLVPNTRREGNTVGGGLSRDRI